MRNIKLSIRYDGTEFHGFQRQDGGVRTAQGEIEKALRSLLGEEIETAGAARTDAGVHALGQVVSFQTATNIPPDKIAPALRRLLPPDLQTVSSEEAAVDFNARFSAKGKEYNYIFCRTGASVPFLRNLALHVRSALDVEEMKKALAFLEGEHDFSAFRNEGSTPTKPVRTITSTSVTESGFLLIISVCGSGFLYKMVRNIAGMALEVGRGKLKAETVPEIIESRDRSLAGPTLPPHGLYLIRVDY